MIKKKIINKIRNLRNALDIIKYRLYNLLKKNVGTNIDNEENSQLIVSLTTYPKRFDVVFLTIESLLNQTVKPQKVILWLIRQELEGKKIPSNILKLKSRGLEIRIVNENYKAYNKLIFTLDAFPESNIITCDDDIIYPTNFIEKLLKRHKELPDCIIAYRCTLMKKCENTLSPYISWNASEQQDPAFDLFPTGVGGILYPPHSLHEKVLDTNLFLKLSPFNDDIWFKGMALLNGTKTAMVNANSIEFPIIKGSQDDALWHINVTENKNDEQLKNVFDYFNLYDYIHLKDNCDD